MASKIVFIAFAKEDEASRNLFTGQRVHPNKPFEFDDMSVKEPYKEDWKIKVRTRVRRSDGVIALISSHTPKATGQLWEIKCAVEEKKISPRHLDPGRLPHEATRNGCGALQGLDLGRRR